MKELNKETALITGGASGDSAIEGRARGEGCIRHHDCR